MQITETYSNGTLPISQGGDVPSRKFADELREQSGYHRLIQVRRAVGFWWYRLLLIVIAGLISSFLAPLFLSHPRIIIGGLGAVVLLFFVVKYVDWGILLVAIFATAFFPVVLQVKSLNASAEQPLIILFFALLFVQIVFHVRKPVFPWFWSIWPWLGMLAMVSLSLICLSAIGDFFAGSFFLQPHQIRGNDLP